MRDLNASNLASIELRDAITCASRSEMPMSLSCYWVSGMEQLGGLVAERDGGSWVDGYGLGLIDNVGGSNNFGKDQIWVQQKTSKRSATEFFYDRLLFWAMVLGVVWVIKIGYDGCILRLKGCPKGILGGDSKMVGFRLVKKKKTKVQQ
ncbi:hypothetical protein B296_00035031 [Ensete ventricosum]|uniref:Uncharacterized protein n=1 Tax=Ensete ventricosum TaxID=4639 RepID=A0A426XLT6_ENSVE|nr:hypothetical protein B296_00035031 [Ensete ventricosum]